MDNLRKVAPAQLLHEQAGGEVGGRSGGLLELLTAHHVEADAVDSPGSLELEHQRTAGGKRLGSFERNSHAREVDDRRGVVEVVDARGEAFAANSVGAPPVRVVHAGMLPSSGAGGKSPDKIPRTVDALDLALRLLRRIQANLSDAELSAWARERLRESQGEQAVPFAGEEESLKDMLKRCAVATEPGFELSEGDLRAMVARLGSGTAPLSPERLKSAGPFLVCRRPGILPAGKGAFRSICPRCASPIVLPARRLAFWAESGASLVCSRCAGSRVGRVVEALPTATRG